MKKKLIIKIFIFSALALAGCVSSGGKMGWVKPGADEAALMQAEDGCSNMAVNLDPQRRYMNFDSCMHSKGWSLTDAPNQKSETSLK